MSNLVYQKKPLYESKAACTVIDIGLSPAFCVIYSFTSQRFVLAVPGLSGCL
jgi:hypothetical protein